MGASHYFDIFAELNHTIIPAMQTLVDFKGCRVVALPLLPISKDTLVYGSCDGGHTVHDKDDTVRKAMGIAAKRLHLAAHRVSNVVMLSAGDVEVHRAQDGNFYLIDLARCFPPESILAVKNKAGHEYPPSSIFHRMVRPEALIIWKKTSQGEAKPVSPDAFTNWGIIDRDQHDQVAYDCTVFILTDQVEKLSNHLLTGFKTLNDSTSVNLAVAFHEFGVNMRHIGLVAEHCEKQIMNSVTEDSKDSPKFFAPVTVLILCSEILFRALKNILRRLLRNASKSTNSELKKMLVWFVNIVFKELPYILHSVDLDFLKNQIVDNYGASAFRLVLKYSDLWKSHLGIILLRVFRRCGIEVEDETVAALSSKSLTSQLKKLSTLEILSFSSSVKKMAAFDIGFSNQLIHLADNSKSEDAIRWRRISLKLLNECLSRFPNDRRIQAMISEQMAYLFMPSENLGELLSFQDQKALWINVSKLVMRNSTTDQVIRCGMRVKNHSKFLGIQCLLFFLELQKSELEKDPYDLMPNFLVGSDFVFPEEIDLDVSVLELLMLIQLARMEYFTIKKKRISPSKYDSKKLSQRFGALSPECSLLFAINHNTYEGYESLDLRVQMEIVSRLQESIRCDSLKDVKLVYMNNFSKLPPRLIYAAMLLPQDFSSLLNLDGQDDTQVKILNLYA
jgi:hypothetical protein